MSNKTTKVLAFICLIAGCVLLIVGCILLCIPNKDVSTNIQEPQIVEIKDTAAYASRVEEWLVPDSLSPQREEIITVTALLSAYDRAPKLDILYKYYLEDNDIIYENSLEKSLNQYFNDYGLKCMAMSDNLMPDEIFELVQDGIPIVSWITNDGELPQWTDNKIGKYSEYTNQMTAIVCGIEGNDVILLDPLHGMVSMDIDEFTVLYEACGCHALWLKQL